MGRFGGLIDYFFVIGYLYLVKQPHLNIDKISEFVIIPGDPGRIDKIAAQMSDFEEVAFNREFRTANAKYNGKPISLVSTGIGCPSAAIAVEELAKIGAKTVIRIGTCGGLLPAMESGDIVIPTSAACYDGTTREYDPTIKTVDASPRVVSALEEVTKKLNVKYFKGINRTHDAFYESTENFIALEGKGYVSSEMECSAVFLVSKLRNLKAGAVLIVNTPEPPELVKTDPEAIYKLVDQKKVDEGMANAIKITLQAIENLISQE